MGNTRRIAILALAFCSECFATSIGVQNESKRSQINFGPPKTVNVCVYLDDGVGKTDAEYLLGSWDSEAPLYGLFVHASRFEKHPRSGFTFSGILKDVEQIPLGPECDRVLYFVNRNLLDYVYVNFPNPVLWPNPEVLGAVDDEAMTHGFVVAARDSINGVFLSPYRITRHELYHLLAGCPHALVMNECYDRIAELKRRATTEFFPSESAQGLIYENRNDIGAALGAAHAVAARP